MTVRRMTWEDMESMYRNLARLSTEMERHAIEADDNGERRDRDRAIVVRDSAIRLHNALEVFLHMEGE